jgi:hypothetical protein
MQPSHWHESFITSVPAVSVPETRGPGGSPAMFAKRFPTSVVVSARPLGRKMFFISNKSDEEYNGQ